MSTVLTRKEMQRALYAADPSYDGLFFTAVKTTGIFCRPSCPARKPKPTNIEYFLTQRQALFAGYRPCKRCRPMDTSGRAPSWLAPLLRRVETEPQSRLKARDLLQMKIDPARASRYFLKHHGMTFNAYQRARRLGMALHQIRQGKPVVSVALAHGYDSKSGFTEAFRRTFGISPAQGRAPRRGSRAGGGWVCITTRMIESPLGPLLAGASEGAVCLLEFTDRRALENQVRQLTHRFKAPLIPGRTAVLDQLERELGEYFAGHRRAFTISLAYPGTPFQVQVWKALLQIPYGRTCSYEQIAESVGRPGAQRAVGTANGANRIAIVIPCHRVVNKDGELGGYGGGVHRKQFLLDLERAVSRKKESGEAREQVNG